VKQPSFLATCYRRAIPIFVGAVQDGSIFLNIVKLKRLFPETFKLEIDVNDDVYEMGAMQHYCLRALDKKMAVFILGGGVPKNYTLQGEPLLEQILGVHTDGFDIDVQFCVDPVDNGALSSCPAGEGHTWGKVSPEGVSRSMYVPRRRHRGLPVGDLRARSGAASTTSGSSTARSTSSSSTRRQARHPEATQGQADAPLDLVPSPSRGHVEESDYRPNGSSVDPDADLDRVYLEVAGRELEEELGVAAPDLREVGRSGPIAGVHYEQIRLYLGTSDGPYRPQPEEVEAVRAVSRAELAALAAREPVTPTLLWLALTPRPHHLALRDRHRTPSPERFTRAGDSPATALR
jgi:hypothetical protein